MNNRLILFGLLLVLASTALAAPGGGPAPIVQFWPPHVTLYSGETASIRAFLFGDWGDRTSVVLQNTSSIITVPPKVEAGAGGGYFEVATWKPGLATITSMSPAGRFSHVTVTVLAHEVFAISPGRASIAGGKEVTIDGIGFSPACSVWFDDIPAPQVTVVDRQTIVATTPQHSAGTADVRVFCGAYANVSPAAFEFIVPRQRSVRH